MNMRLRFILLVFFVVLRMTYSSSCDKYKDMTSCNLAKIPRCFWNSGSCKPIEIQECSPSLTSRSCYYIDPKSAESTENGSLTYPYKDFSIGLFHASQPTDFIVVNNYENKEFFVNIGVLAKYYHANFM